MKRFLVKCYLRFIGILIISLILLFILNIIFAFGGNPIKSSKAEIAIKKYANNKFDISNYNMSEVQYLFKPNQYYISMENKTIKDDHFNIYYNCNDGTVDSSEYNNVVNKINTVQRLSKEYSEKIRKLFEEILPKEEFDNIEDISIKFTDSKYKSLQDIKLDESLENIFSYPTYLMLTVKGSKLDEFSIATKMRLYRRILIENNFMIDFYSYKFFNNFDDFTLSNIPSNYISIHNFDEKLKEIKNLEIDKYGDGYER